MFDLLFPEKQQVLLVCSVIGTIAATFFQQKGKTGWALILLTLAAFLVRLFAVHLDPFLNAWDECFHATVARRMVMHPFTPMLHAAPELQGTWSWTETHMWLHKPPFFLWQMAACIQLFGAEPWVVRLPSALWLTALVPVGYRIGTLLANAQVGWGTAVFLTCSYYLEELTAGAINTDHNDAVFIATVICSWWALLELWNDGRWRWAVWAGVFAACAVLTKWYVGLSVFLPWGVVVAMNGFRRKEVRDLSIGVGAAGILAGAWIVSIVSRFPKKVAYEWAIKAEHLSQVMGGHTGTWAYHFDVIREVLPPFSPWYVLPAYAWLVWKAGKKEHRVFLIVLFMAVHLAFGYARNKMVSYTMVLLPLYMAALAQGLIGLAGLIPARYRSWLIAVAVPMLGLWMLDLPRLHHRHTVSAPSFADQRWRRQQLDALQPLARLKELVPGDRPVAVLHVPAVHHIQFMFNTGHEAWDRMPDRADVEQLIREGYAVYAVQDGVPLDSFPSGVMLIPDSVLCFPNVGRPGS